MKIFYIYKHLTKKDDIKIYAQGSSIFAGIFNIFWAIYHSMWHIVFLNLTIFFVLKHFNFTMMFEALEMIQLIAFFTFTDELHKLNMKIKGYKLDNIIYANTNEDAEFKHIKRNLEINNAI